MREEGGREGRRCYLCFLAHVCGLFTRHYSLSTSLLPSLPPPPPSGMGMGGGFGGPGASPPRKNPPRKAEPVEYNFNVTLEDLHTGGKNKKMRITKKVKQTSMFAFPPSLPPSLLPFASLPFQPL